MGSKHFKQVIMFYFPVSPCIFSLAHVISAFCSHTPLITALETRDNISYTFKTKFRSTVLRTIMSSYA